MNSSRAGHGWPTTRDPESNAAYPAPSIVILRDAEGGGAESTECLAATVCKILRLRSLTLTPRKMTVFALGRLLRAG